MSDEPTIGTPDAVDAKPARERKTKGGNGPIPPVDLPPPISEPLKSATLSRFRIENTNFVEAVKPVLTTVLIAQPPKGEFIRVHPDRSMALITVLLRVKRERYLIEPGIYPELCAKVKDFNKLVSCVTLRPYQTREGGQITLWPLSMESPHSIGGNSWRISAFNAAQAAETTWLRITADTTRGIYTACEPEGIFADPEWPDMTIDALVDIAGHINRIASIDDGPIRDLRGLT